MIRPHFFCFMAGTASRVVWNAEERLIAMIASHFSAGKSSTGETCWMPALLTRMSGPPSSSAQRFIIRSISSGLDMSAPSCSAPSSSHSRAIAEASPKPLIISFAPSDASALAIARPIPEVDPVNSATLSFSVIDEFSYAALSRGGRRIATAARPEHYAGATGGNAMRFGDERESSNIEDVTGRSGGGFGFGGGGGSPLGCLIPLIASRFGIGGVVVVVIGYFLLSSLGGLGGGG